MRSYTRIAITTAAVSLTAVAAYAAAQAQARPEAGAQAGAYRLVTFAGRALPTVVEEEDGCREEVLSATLTLEAGGRWVLATRERETCGAEVEEDEDSESGTFTASGAALRFAEADDDDRPSDDDVDLDELGGGTLAGDELTVRLTDDRTVLVFRR